jgi:MFS family permease
MSASKDKPPASAISSFNLSVVVGANGLLQIASSTNGALIGFYLAFLATHNHLANAALLGAIGTTYSISELSGAVPFGLLADRIPLRNILVTASIAAAVTTLFFGLTHQVVFFLLLRAIEGISASANDPSLLAFITDATQQRAQSRGRWMGYFEISFLVGLALGGLVGGRFWDIFHPLAFGLVALIYLFAAGLFFWGVQPKAKSLSRGGNPLTILRGVFADPFLKRLAPAWLAVNAIIGMWINQIGFQLTGPRVAGQYLVGHFSATRVGIIWLGFALIFTTGVMAWGLILPSMPRIRALRGALGGVFLACIALYLLNSPLGQEWPWQILAFLLLVLSILLLSGFVPTALAYLADVAGMTRNRGSVMGVYTLLLGLGEAVGAGIGGLLAHALAINGMVVGTVVLGFIALAAIALIKTK